MFRFHKTESTPRTLSNIFLEFEEQFASVVHWSIEDTTEYEIILDENGEEFDHPISITWERIFDKIKNEIILEKYFDELINAIYSHINEQLKKYNNWECASFFNSNNLFFEDFKPEKRVKEINIRFFEGLAGRSYEVILDEIQTELKTYSINLYQTHFYKFYLRFKEFESIFSKVNGDVNHSLNSKQGIKSKRDVLHEVHFFDLNSVRELTFEKQEQLITLMFAKKTPYQVALLDHLGLFDFLEKTVSPKSRIFEIVASTLEVSARSLKGNYYVLNENSTENRERYSSYLHKGKVKKDLEKIFRN
jgi:hypothetical protein